MRRALCTHGGHAQAMHEHHPAFRTVIRSKHPDPHSVRNMREARVSHKAKPTFHVVDRILFLQRHNPTGTIVEAPSDEDPLLLSHFWVWHGMASCEYRGSSAIERSGRPPCFVRGKVGYSSEKRPGMAAGIKTLSN
jgi:hypothetical protein